MRDFGFWVRIIAISQLFSLVLSNYGDGWLAHDNPVLNLAGKSAQRLAPTEEPAAESPAKMTEADDESGAGNWEEQYSAGWGGFEAPEMGPAAPEHPEYVRNGSLAPDLSSWAED